jgi:hypothetical protein
MKSRVRRRGFFYVGRLSCLTKAIDQMAGRGTKMAARLMQSRAEDVPTFQRVDLAGNSNRAEGSEVIEALED